MVDTGGATSSGMTTDGSAEDEGGPLGAQDAQGRGGPSAAEEPEGESPSWEMSLRLEAQSLAHMLTHKPKNRFCPICDRQNKPLTYVALSHGLCQNGVRS